MKGILHTMSSNKIEKRKYIKKIGHLCKKIKPNITFSLVISLIALSATANFNRITSLNSKLNDLYNYSVEYLINLEKKELLYVSKNERSVTTKQEEIQINIKEDFYFSIIMESINKENTYSKDLEEIIKTATDYHELEIEKLTTSRQLSVAKDAGDAENQIQNLKRRYNEINDKQDKLIKGDEDLVTKYKKTVINYYLEEKKSNRFKLFYFF